MKYRFSNLIFQFRLVPENYELVMDFWGKNNPYVIMTNLDGTKRFRYAFIPIDKDC
jgi:hypothetical protein